MSFGKNVSDFSTNVFSEIDIALEAQESKIKHFLAEFLGEEISEIESIEFDNDESKFFNLKAPRHIVDKFKAACYLKDS